MGDDPTFPIDEVRLGHAGQPVVAVGGAAAVTDGDVIDLEAAQEAMRVGREVLYVDAQERDAALVRLRGGDEDRGFSLAWNAPRSPEVEHDGVRLQLSR